MATLSLVNYSDDSSDSNADENIDNNTKEKFKPSDRKRNMNNVQNEDDMLKKSRKTNDQEYGILPSVPSDILNMFSDTSDRTKLPSDPSKHQGRVRSFQHEAGNWASLVYIPLGKSEELEDFVASVLDLLRPYGEFVVSEDFHVSLSRTFVLKHHWIDSFVDSLRKSLGVVERLSLALSTVDVFTNDEKTRTFVVLRSHNVIKQLKNMVDKIDSCLAEFRLSPYYSNPSFHVSVCWSVGNVKSSIPGHVLSTLQKLFDNFVAENPEQMLIPVRELVCKTGNKYFNISLDVT